MADDGSGFVYAFTRMGGVACDQIKIGHTRNHPSIRAQEILHRNRTDHWRYERDILAAHRSDPPQLWASFTTDRKAAEREIHQKLVAFSMGGEVFISPSAQTVLAVMAAVTGKDPEQYPLVPPVRVPSPEVLSVTMKDEQTVD